MEYAETALENVHDGIVDALPLVDHPIFMNTHNNIRRGIIFALAQSLIDSLLIKPAILARKLFLGKHNLAQKLNVTA